MEGTMTFGEGMKAAREEKGLSQAELARKVGLSRTAICRYEKMRRTNISFPIAVSISQALDMNINDYYPNERSIPMCNNDKCENNIKEALNEKELNFFLDGYIDETDDDVVVVPREEYDELIAGSTILRVVERIVGADSIPSYNKADILKEILDLGKPESETDAQPVTQSAPTPDKEDAE